MKLLLRGFAVILLLILGLISLARRENSGWIAFQAVRDSGFAVDLMESNGNSRRNISHSPMCGRYPSWSPDGSQLVIADRCLSRNDLLLMSPNGVVLDVIGISRGIEAPQWSPDGNRLLMTEGSPNTRLYVLEVDSGDYRVVAANHVKARWSPDGEWIYASPNDTLSLNRIHVETTVVEPVIDSPTHFLEFDWSPDGSQMVVVMKRNAGYELFLMTPNDATSMRVISIDNPPSQLYTPRWSPDSEWVAFLGYDGGDFEHVYRVRPDGRDFQQLTFQMTNILRLQWSLDSEWLIFDALHADTANIYRVSVGGSALERLAQGSQPQIAPISGLDWHPLPLTLAAIMMLVASVAFHHGAFRVIMGRVVRVRRKIT